jgi:outer membrane protein
MKKVILFGSCILLFAAMVHAQTTGTGEPSRQWTLQDCIDYAKRNNFGVNSLRLSGAAAMQDLFQAENNKLPAVYGSFSQAWIQRKTSNGLSGGTQAPASFSSNYGVSSSLVLYNGGYLTNSIKAGQLQVQAVRLAVEETTNDITLRITQAFLDVLLAKENSKVFEELLATSEAQLKRGQLRYDAGGISKKELLQFESQIASDRYNLTSARNAVALNLLSLKQLLQLPISYEMSVATPVQIEPQEAVLPLPSAQQAALATRAEVKSKEVALNLAAIDRDLAKAGRLPTIDIGAGLFSGYANSQSSKYFSQLNKNLYETVSIGASIPIFSRRQNKTNLVKADIAIDQAKLALQETRLVLAQQVEQAYINLQNAQAQYKAAAAQLKAAEEIYNITQEQLKYGAINMVEVLQQKASYVQALQANVQAKYTAILYNKIYQFYTGEPITF